MGNFEPPERWRRLDAAEIDEWDCEPLRPIIEKIVAKGTLVWMAADSQTGKSLFSLWLCLQMLSKSKLFGKYQITPVNKIGYMVLEDPDRRVEARLRDMGVGIKEPDRLIFWVAPTFKLTDENMCEWLEGEIEREHFDVLFIDTYQRSTGGLSSFDDEKQLPILQGLADLTRDADCAIFVLDHMRKSIQGFRRKGQAQQDRSDIKGTGGKQQNADGIIILQRDDSGDDKIVSVQSWHKDWDDELNFRVVKSPQGSKEPKFKFHSDVGETKKENAQTKAARETARKIYDHIGEQWKQIGKIAKEADVPLATAKRHVTKFVTDGKLESNDKPSNQRAYRRIPPADQRFGKKQKPRPSAQGEKPL